MAELPSVTVTGTLYNPDQTLFNGSIRFEMPVMLRHADGTAVAPASFTHPVVDGEVSVDLLYVDAPGWTPEDWAWQVTIPRGSIKKTYTISPSVDDPSVNFGDLLIESYQVSLGNDYALLNHTHPLADDAVTSSELTAALGPYATSAQVSQDFAPISHGHPKSAITGLTADLDSINTSLTGKAARDLLVAPRYRAQPQLTMFETFQSANGWSANFGSWNADLVNHALGSRCITTTTAGTGGANTYRKTGVAPANLSTKNFAFLVKVDLPTRLTAFNLYLGTGSFAAFAVLTAGSGGIPANATVQPNTWTWIYFSWADVTSSVGTLDRTAVTDYQVRVQDNNTGPLTFSINAVATYNKPALFPKGVVTFNFDDCWLSQSDLAAPTLAMQGYAANSMVIVEALSGADPTKFNQATLDKLRNNYRWEVGGHAYTFSAHNAGFSTLTNTQLDDELYNLRDWLRRGGYKGHDLFAYPLGDDNNTINETVGRFFTFARQITRTPSVPLPVDQPLRLRAYSVSSSDTLATVQGKVDSAYTNGTWLILCFHKLVTVAPVAGTEWPNADFTSLVSYIAGKGDMPVLTMGAVLEAIRAV